MNENCDRCKCPVPPSLVGVCIRCYNQKLTNEWKSVKTKVNAWHKILDPKSSSKEKVEDTDLSFEDWFKGTFETEWTALKKELADLEKRGKDLAPQTKEQTRKSNLLLLRFALKLTSQKVSLSSQIVSGSVLIGQFLSPFYRFLFLL